MTDRYKPRHRATAREKAAHLTGEKLALADGTPMPLYSIDLTTLTKSDSMRKVLGEALDQGIRGVITHPTHDREIIEMLMRARIDRNGVFLAARLALSSQRDEVSIRRSVKQTLKSLDVEKLDMLIVSGPPDDLPHLVLVWKILENFVFSGKITHLAVCDYSLSDVRHLVKYGNVKPSLVQLGLVPSNYAQLAPIIKYCRSKDIPVQAYLLISALACPRVDSISFRYDRTMEQIWSRWILQHNLAVVFDVPNRKLLGRMLDVFDFRLQQKEMKRLNAVGGDAPELNGAWSRTHSYSSDEVRDARTLHSHSTSHKHKARSERGAASDYSLDDYMYSDFDSAY